MRRRHYFPFRVPSGAWPPACWVIVHQFRSGISLTPRTRTCRMLPRSRPGKAPPQRARQLSPLPDRPPSPVQAAAPSTQCHHERRIVKRLRSHPAIPHIPPGQASIGSCRTGNLGISEATPGNWISADRNREFFANQIRQC
jgi:hypothetical protein